MIENVNIVDSNCIQTLFVKLMVLQKYCNDYEVLISAIKIIWTRAIMSLAYQKNP